MLHGRTFHTLTAMLQLLGEAQGEAGLHDMVAQPTIAAFAEALSHTASARGATLAAHEQLDRLSRKFGIVWADEGNGIGDGQKYPSFTTARQAA